MHKTQNEQHKTQTEENYIELRNMWMVEWSENQGWFHVGNIDEMIGKNIRAYIDGQTTDYAIVGIADTQEDAEKLMHLLRKERKAPLPDQLPDEVMLADSAFEIVSPTAPPPANKYKLKPLASAARKNHFKPISSPPARGGVAAASADEVVGAGNGREIIPLKRR